MVTFIIGKKDVGKTMRLRSLFEEQPGAWGFCSEKIHDCGRVTSYELVDLRTGETHIAARLMSLPVPADFGDEIHHGIFRFAVEGFEWARKLFNKAVDAGAKSFFIDELGKLELKGSGYADLILAALKTDMDLFIATRDINIGAAVETFGITDYQTIEVVQPKD